MREWNIRDRDARERDPRDWDDGPPPNWRGPMPRPYPGDSYRSPSMDEGGGRGGRGFIYVLMLVLLVAFGGAIWRFYDTGGGTRAPPHIAAQSGEYRTAPADDQTIVDEHEQQNAMYDALDGHEDATPTTPRAGPETPIDTTTTPAPQPAGPPRVGAAPRFAGNGPFVAQVAALQSEAAASAAWTRLSSRAPDLFSPAHMDVERADLGQRGVYYRVRAGYFADRTNATRFCDRIKQMGQDCIVVAR